MEKDYIAPVGEGLYIARTGDWRTRRPQLDQASCRRCGICLMYCPVNSIVRSEAGEYSIDYEFCKGCGICSVECPAKSISMHAAVRA